MADFPAALDGALRAWFGPDRAVRSPVDSTRGRQARMNALERAFGSGKDAAAAAGIGPSTWRSWKTTSGKRRAPSAVNQAKLEDAYRALVREVTVRRRGIPTLMTVTAVVVADPRRARYVNKTPHRPFKADRDRSSRGPAAAAAAAFLDGDPPSEVAAVALASIEQAYGMEFAFEGGNVTVDLE